jgi:hypothetical protein
MPQDIQHLAADIEPVVHVTAADDATSAVDDAHLDDRSLPRKRRSRTVTNTAEIDSTIIHPGSVRINVKGAFIVETPGSRSPRSPTGPNGSPPLVGSYYETKDIRLPNHTAVVSHIAVDVRICPIPSTRPSQTISSRLTTASRLAARWPSWSTFRARPILRNPVAASTFSTSRRTGSTTVSSL